MLNRHGISFLFLLAGVISARANAQQRVDATVDSVVLERTRCFGTCPAYQLRVTAAGNVFFRSLNPGDTSRTAEDRISTDSWNQLLILIDGAKLSALPSDVREDKRLCPVELTDHPTAIVSVYRAETRTIVRDYFGCYLEDRSPSGALLQLRQLEANIDHLTRAERWIQTPRSRP